MSIQMGFGRKPGKKCSDYYANNYYALKTNSWCDTRVKDPAQIKNDLYKIGFNNFEHWIRPPGPGDTHPNWIFFTAVK